MTTPNIAAKTEPWNSPKLSKFNDRNLAFSFAQRCTKPHWVILGDDNKYWVAPAGLANQLNQLGYEYAE
ncbi:MAG: hypothetical protein K8L97_27245 [Anaerolineae bacterium]|nr:hypothetical protein [Anaerolineae bacterium]